MTEDSKRGSDNWQIWLSTIKGLRLIDSLDFWIPVNISELEKYGIWFGDILSVNDSFIERAVWRFKFGGDGDVSLLVTNRGIKKIVIRNMELMNRKVEKFLNLSNINLLYTCKVFRVNLLDFNALEIVSFF